MTSHQGTKRKTGDETPVAKFMLGYKSTRMTAFWKTFTLNPDVHSTLFSVLLTQEEHQTTNDSAGKENSHVAGELLAYRF